MKNLLPPLAANIHQHTPKPPKPTSLPYKLFIAPHPSSTWLGKHPTHWGHHPLPCPTVPPCPLHRITTAVSGKVLFSKLWDALRTGKVVVGTAAPVFPLTHRGPWKGGGNGITDPMGTDLGWEQVDLHDAQPPCPPPGQAEHLLQHKEAAGNHEPLPEVGTMQDEEDPDGDVGEVGPVEDLR